MKRGRKTKYRPEYCNKIIEFFNVEPYEEIRLPHYNEDGSIKWEDVKRFARKLPTLVQFAKYIGASYPTVYRWQDEKDGAYQKEFQEAYARAKESQKDFLIQAGCLGVYNSHFAIFTAKNITDMRDSSDLNVKGGFNLNVICERQPEWMNRREQLVRNSN